MKKDYAPLKLFVGYLLILFLMLISNTANGQSPCGESEICVVQFNAGFNETNKVEWVDIQISTKAAGIYKIVVVPTIVIYSEGNEVARFQANIMMQMEATRKEVQSKIDEIIMSNF